jgi:tetratricopeptide (TPR) repeat protein
MKVFKNSLKLFSQLTNFTSKKFMLINLKKANFGGCGSSCGCHSNKPNKEETKEDKIEKDLKGMNNKIIEFINLGKYDEALELSEDFINMIKTNFGDEHPFYCSALNNKAFILKTVGSLDEAQVIFEEVVEKYKKLYGENNEKVIITLHNLGTLLKEAKEFDKSIAIYEKILKIIKEQNVEVEGEQSGKLRLNIIANIYNSAGGLYRQIKNYKESDRLFNLALNIIKANFGDRTLPAATVINNIGLSLKDQGKLTEAMERYNEVLSIREELLDKDHPEVNLIKHNIEQLNLEMKTNKNI